MIGCIASTRDATGLATAAENLGFCRNTAESSVEPERGRPDIKWKVVDMKCVLINPWIGVTDSTE